MEKLINIPEEFQKYIVSQVPKFNGLAIRLEFPNGYGASVIKHDYSYGLEVAVIGLDGFLDYETPITDDVVSDLNDVGLVGVLRDIMELKSDGDD